MSGEPTYEVTFHFTDGETHTLAKPMTRTQLDALRANLDIRLNPPPRRDNPDELPLVDGRPADDTPTVTFQIGETDADFGTIVPAAHILRITWQRV